MKMNNVKINRLGVKSNYYWLFLCCAIALFLLFQFGFKFNGLYGQDSHAYYQYGLDLVERFSGKETDISFFFWPKLFPFLGAVISLTGISVNSSLLLLSFLSFTGTLIYSNKIIHLLNHKNASIYILIAAVSQIYFMRGGYLVMSDMLAAFFCIASVYYFLRFNKTANWVYFFVFFIAAILAFFSRYASIVLLSVPTIYILIKGFIKLNIGYRAVTLFLFFGSFILLVWFNGNFINSLWYVLETWSPLNLFSRTFETPDGIVTNFVPNGFYIFGNFFHLGYLSLGLFLIPFYSKLKVCNRVLVLSVIVYLLFLGGHPMQNYRFLMIVHPFVLIILYPAFESLQNWLLARKIFVSFVIGILIFNLSFGWYSFQKTLRVHRVEKEVVNAIKLKSKNEIIYSFYIDQSFKSYGIKNQVKNFYYQNYDSFDKGALVVFNEEKFKEQWKGHHVMQNWERLKSDYHLDTVSLLSDNWTLYRIK